MRAVPLAAAVAVQNGLVVLWIALASTSAFAVQNGRVVRSGAISPVVAARRNITRSRGTIRIN